MRMTSSNPVLKRAMQSGQPGYGQPYQAPYGQGGHSQQPYGQYPQQGYPGGVDEASRPMTIDDVVMRTGMTIGMVILTAVVSFLLFDPLNPGLGMLLTFGGMIGGLVLGLIIGFKQSTNPVLILVYAALEGLFVGGISRLFEMMAGAEAGGLVTPAVFGTVFAFATMLTLYKTRVIRVTNTFVKVVMGALVAALVLILANLLLSFFIPGGLGLREPSMLGVIVTLVLIVIACATLAIEFRGIEDGIAAGVPNRMAWQFAFGLTVSLVWLYIEIIRLLWMLQAIFGGE
ncbi:Bax inhibitor-1/YccA family protein [Allosalinactinospora lopnorensis]|uniref:Bax inhibitor-1/YccA family protein n=1 Tax=Allosalinactinospora lopnorensis TaxID=1352348 RepID=UPI000623DC33|nr:Bax inhibitor-1/YccA family protein [Allosalinactinospora lopnorensis]